MSPPLMSPSAVLADTRLSFDSDRPPTLNGVNGTNGKHSHRNSKDEDDAGLDMVDRLQRDLTRTNEEKEQLATQYRNLLAKLTTMRTQLGNKLKQDAVCISLLYLVCLNLKLVVGRAGPARTASVATRSSK